MADVAVPGIFPSPPTDTTEITGDALATEICRNAVAIRHIGVRVRGPVELKSANFSHRVELLDVTFEDAVDMRDAQFLKTVDLRGCTFRGGLRMEGARIDGSLLMMGATLGRSTADERRRSARMSLLRVGGHFLGRGIEAEGTVDLTRAEVRGHVNLSSLPTRRTCFADDLIMNAASIGGDLRLEGILLKGALEAEASRVKGKLSACPLRADPERQEGAVLQVAEIGGRVHLACARVTGEVGFTAAKIGKGLNFQAAEIRGGLFCRILLGHQPHVGGDLAGPAARILTTLDLSGARIGGEVFMEGATIQGTVFLENGWTSCEGAPPLPDGGRPHETAPRMPDLRTHIGGPLKMAHITVTGSIRAVDVQVDGDAVLADATVTGAVSFSQSVVVGDLTVDAAKITRGFYCRSIDGRVPHVHGSITGTAAQIGSGVFLSGARVGRDVIFAAARVEGPVKMEARTISTIKRAPDVPAESLDPPGPHAAVSGNVDFGHATVAGALKLAQLESATISLEGATVTGYLDLGDARVGELPATISEDDPNAGFQVAGAQERAGALNATGLRLLGYAHFSGIHLSGDLNLQNARIEGGIRCGAEGVSAGKRPIIRGSVLLGGATVLVQADFRAAWIGGDLSLERATIDGMLRCRLLTPDKNNWRDHLCTRVRQVNLRNCTVDYLDLQGIERRGNGAPGKPGIAQDVPILLEGCQFHELSVPGGEKEKDYLFFFRAQDGNSFRQSNYVLVEQWLRNRGDDDAAERVYRLMRKRRRAELRNRPQRMSDWIVCELRAVALHFQALIIASLVTYLITVAIFSSPRSVVSEPGDGAGTAVEERAASGGTAVRPARWDVGDAALLATHIHLPMLSFPTEDRWAPAPGPITKRMFSLRFDAYATIISLLSYAVIPLIIGGLATTWLQRRAKS